MDFSILVYVLNKQITNKKTMGQSLNKLAHRIRCQKLDFSNTD